MFPLCYKRAISLNRSTDLERANQICDKTNSVRGLSNVFTGNSNSIVSTRYIAVARRGDDRLMEICMRLMAE